MNDPSIPSATTPGPATPSLGRGAAAITIATAVSRVTGFLRVVAVAAALGTTFLANTYQSANTAPNLVFELLAAGVLTSVFVPTFVEHLVKGERERGWDAANALTSVAFVALTVISIGVALAAPLIMRLFLIGVDDPATRDASVDLGARFLRLFSPQIVLYGAGMIMTGALHAHRRFALPAIAPIFNNLVVIATYLGYIALRDEGAVRVGSVSSAEVYLLGVGTTMGVLAMTVALIPGLRRLGWRFRFNFRPSHPAVRRGARLAVWALGYAGGYQAGLIVVLILANRIEGGVAAYQWAFTFFYLPHALLGVPVFHVLFTAMAEHVSRGEPARLAGRLREGMAMLGFGLIPIALALTVLADPLARVTLEYGVMDRSGSELVARTLAAFTLGLPSYSAFLVITRGFYALSDTKTPALVNAATVAVASLLGAGLFLSAPDRWAVPALALAHSIAFALGAVVLWILLSRSIGEPMGRELPRSLRRSAAAAVPAALLMWGTSAAVAAEGKIGALADLLAAGFVGSVAYLWLMHRARAPELARLVALTRQITRRS